MKEIEAEVNFQSVCGKKKPRRFPKVCVMKKRYADGVVPESSESARAEIASQLKLARISANMTQQNLAEACGTKKSNISRMESGRYNPSLDFLVKVANSMGKQVSIKVE